jgi:hypothetical protein
MVHLQYSNYTQYSATLLSLLPIASKGWEYSTKINFPTILLNKNYFYPPHKKIFFLQTFLHTLTNLQTFLHICEIIEHFRKHFRSNIKRKSTQKSATQLLRIKIPKPCEHFCKRCKHICNSGIICEILQTSSKALLNYHNNKIRIYPNLGTGEHP